VNADVVVGVGRAGSTAIRVNLPATATHIAFLADLLILVGETLQLGILEMLDIDHLVLRLVDRFDDFVKFQVNSPRVAVLRVLDQEHDQKSYDCCACVDYELPSIRISKKRS